MRNAVLAALAFAVGFTALPWVLYPPYGTWPVGVYVHMAGMDLAIIAVAAGTALITSALRRRVSRHGFEIGKVAYAEEPKPG